MHLLLVCSVHQQAAVQNASSVLHLWAAVAASAHYVQRSSASSPARPSTTMNTASCQRRASVTFSPQIMLCMMELSLQRPTCNTTDWPVIYNLTPPPLQTELMSVFLSTATGWRHYIIFKPKKYFIISYIYLFI